MSKFPDIVRIYENQAEFGEEERFVLLYETAANVQENGAGSEVDTVIKSDYAAYCADNSIKTNANCRLDWSSFNKPFSDNPNDWYKISKPAFNYARFGTVIYFDEIGN